MSWFKSFATAMVKERMVPLTKMPNVGGELRRNLQMFVEEGGKELTVLQQAISAVSQKRTFIGRIEKDVINEASQLAALAKIESMGITVDNAVKSTLIIASTAKDVLKKDAKRTGQDLQILMQNLLIVREYVANATLFTPSLSQTGKNMKGNWQKEFDEVLRQLSDDRRNLVEDLSPSGELKNNISFHYERAARLMQLVKNQKM